jgi:integrating conjugative element protein (TIGR03749 family)
MKAKLTKTLLGLPLALVVGMCQAVEVVRWNKLPLAVPLFVGQERVVFVDRNVRVGVPSEVGDRLRIQSAAGAVYLRANEPIEPTRLQLQDAVSGELILIDIQADNAMPNQARLEDMRIVEEAPRQPSDSDAMQPSGTGAAPAALLNTPVQVVLTRYAAQQLYAPLRTVEALPGARRVNVPGDLALDLLMPSSPVSAKALAAWRLGEYWVTAVRITNQSTIEVFLDPRMLLGDFTTAAFQHQHLGPKGRSSDTTVVYITTHGRGLGASLLPNISQVDAALNVPPSRADAAKEGDHEK